MDYVKLLEAVPEIIAAAAKSPLGIFALMILVLSGLALVFFRDAPLWARLLVMAGFFVGVIVFGVSLSQSQERQNYARAYMRAVAAFDQGQYTVGVTHLNAALASVIEQQAHLNSAEVDAWRYYLLTARSLWKAFAEDDSVEGFRERTGLHLRDAYTHWVRMPTGVLPNAYITETRVANLVRYLCADPRVQPYVRPEDQPIREEACKKRLAADPGGAVIALKHLPIPPASRPGERQEEKAYEKARDVLRDEKARRQEMEREVPKTGKEPRENDRERSPRGSR